MPSSQISTVPAPYWPLRDLALELRVLERVVLDVDGEMLLARLERHALRHRPGRERAVALEAEVVVEPARVVALDHEDRLAGLAFAGAGRRNGSGVFFGSRLRRYSLRLTSRVLPKPCLESAQWRHPVCKR